MCTSPQRNPPCTLPKNEKQGSVSFFLWQPADSCEGEEKWGNSLRRLKGRRRLGRGSTLHRFHSTAASRRVLAGSTCWESWLWDGLWCYDTIGYSPENYPSTSQMTPNSHFRVYPALSVADLPGQSRVWRSFAKRGAGMDGFRSWGLRAFMCFMCPSCESKRTSRVVSKALALWPKTFGRHFTWWAWTRWATWPDPDEASLFACRPDLLSYMPPGPR